MKIVILPLWLQKALEFQKLELSKALSAEELLAILSMDDVAFYLHINSMVDKYITECSTDSFMNVFFMDDLSKSETVSVETQDKLNELIGYHAMRSNLSRSRALIGELCDEVKIGLKVELVADDTIGIIPYILDEDADITSAELNFVDELIKCHLITTPFEAVARSQHFKNYVARMSNV